jgi:PKD repeat protein
MKLLYSLILVIGFFSYSFVSLAQISQGGQPISSQDPGLLKSALVFETMPRIDIDRLKAEDLLNDQNKEVPWRFGENIDVNYSLSNSGIWDQFAEGDKVWRLGIKSPGAITINLTFDNYHLPPGAKLFIYNSDKSEIIGAFTEFNNNDSKVFATTLISGDQVVIEYYEPANPVFPGELNLTRVTHGYRSAFDYAKNFGTSGSCENNVNCPEAAGWENNVNSVCMLVSGGNGFCTGALVNNTNQDGVPYILTANHCYSNPSSWVFWFNWQSSTCSNPGSSPQYNSITGATLKARNLASDFCLVQMNNTPPSNYNVYYAGWNRENVAASYGACVHHPDGDIKKISYSNTAFSSDTWSGTPSDSHWKVMWSDGVTEPGSSGAPVFDQEHRVVGQLHGGPSSCGSSQLWDFFGKFSMSWNYGTTPATRLVDWLDPINIAGITLDGYDPNAPLVDFSASTTTPCLNTPVLFTDQSTGTPSAWKWSLTPSTFEYIDGTDSLSQNPHIRFTALGNYTVTLTSTTGGNDHTITKEGYISVNAVNAAFQANSTTVVIGNSTVFTDESSCDVVSWSWNFGDGASPATSSSQGPVTVTYSTLGLKTVTLTINDSVVLTKTDYINVIDAAFNMANATVSACSGNFYDPGGPSANYGNSQDYTLVVNPGTPGKRVQVIFSSFNLESGTLCANDNLKIFDGNSITAPSLGIFCSNNSPDTVTANNADGSLTFLFHSNNSINLSGWVASVSCVEGMAAPFNFSAAAVSNSRIDLSWVPNTQNNGVMVAWSPDGLFGAPVTGSDYQPGNLIPGGGTVLYTGNSTSYSHIGLSPETLYHYKAFSFDQAMNWSNGVDAIATTLGSPTLIITPSIQTVTYPAGSTSFDVSSNYPWAVTSDATWCSVTPSGTGNGVITASYPENTGPYSRTANINVEVAGLTPQVLQVIQLPSFVSVPEGTSPEIALYPNPNSGLFTVNGPSNQQLSMELNVYDALGALVLTKQCAGSAHYSFDLTGSPEGLYYVIAKTAKKTMNWKMVLK